MHPCRVEQIDSVKINPSLVMMRECIICIATLPWIALLALSVGIEFVSSSARVTSVNFAQVAHSVCLLLRDKRTHRSDQGHLGPIKINLFFDQKRLNFSCIFH